MSAVIQLDLLKPALTEMDILKEEIKALEESQNRIRKGLFSRLANLEKFCIEMHERQQELENLLMKRIK